MSLAKLSALTVKPVNVTSASIGLINDKSTQNGSDKRKIINLIQNY
jgi:hypothetical protein